MKIELSQKQCIDIEWSILIAVDTVQQRYLKEKNDSRYTTYKKNLWKLHDYIQKERKKLKLTNEEIRRASNSKLLSLLKEDLNAELHDMISKELFENKRGW